MQPVYLLIGIPGSGKSWICQNLADNYQVLVLSSFKLDSLRYLRAITDAASEGDKPVVCIDSSRLTTIWSGLDDMNVSAIPLFVTCDAVKAEAHQILKQRAYKQIADECRSVIGPKETILSFLKEAHGKAPTR